MNLEEFNEYLRNIPEKINEVAPTIVAETAVEYYKQRFEEKAFDGKEWDKGKPKKRGSLLVESGNLMNSIRPAEVGPERVVISAGNAHVPYAKVHNEGFDGEVTVKSHIRRKKGSTPRKNKNVLYGGDALVTEHKRNMHVVKRQFLGESKELADRIKTRLDDAIDNIL